MKIWTDVGYIKLIGGLVTHNPPKNDSWSQKKHKTFFRLSVCLYVVDAERLK